MSSFSTRVAGSPDTRPDPTKHVNYSLGMVLGEDDFKQEFAYLSGRDQWMARDLVGYGTVYGLAVSVTYDADARAEVVVTPGAAVSPRGQLIRVTPTQCAGLADWLSQERHRDRLGKLPGTAARLPVYVVLSYRECATDDVPIPGEPCRSEEDSMEASRLADNFRLELTFDPPARGEEAALRDFVRWLSQTVVVGDESEGPFATLEQFESAVRGAAGPQSPPSSPPDFMYGSPPGALRVASSDACEFLRAAFRIWVTELRPLWGGQGRAPGVPPNEEGVLLAELSVPVEKTSGDRWVLQHPGLSETEVDESRRPFVLHLRMLQEWVECGRRPPTPADFVTDGTSFGKAPEAGASEAYSRADHDHGTPPQLTGDATSDAKGRTAVGRIGGIPVVPSSATPPFDNQVLLYRGKQWVAADAPPVPLVGDVTGSTDQNEVGALQGVPFLYNPGTARHGQVLTYVLVETGEEGGGGGEEGGEVGGGESADHGGAGSMETARTINVAGETRDYTVQSPPDSPPASPPAPTLRPVWTHADPTIQGAPVRRPDEETSIRNGEVLTFYQPRGGAQGEWRAAPLPDVTLGGDVEGPAGANRLAMIQGVPVADLTTVAPQAGEILTYFVPEGATEGSWSSKPPANLAGDVSGPRHDTLVRGLHGTALIDLSAEANRPQPGQVLTWVVPDETTQGRWQAGTPAAADIDLAGDVTGSPDATTVGAIQRAPVGIRTRAVPFNDGDVLIFRNGSWMPEALPSPPPPREGDTTTAATTGSFVERPSGLPAYSIVAAGIVRGDGTSRGPVYNGLHVRNVDLGNVTVSFDKYVFPGEAFQYVVKAMPVINPELSRARGVVVAFERFLKSEGLGFVLRVTNLGQDVSAEELKVMEFMIEVSRYEAG